MRTTKKIFKWVLYLLLIPVSYLLISLILTLITIDRNEIATNGDKTIFLGTNGVHLDIIIPIKNIDSLVLSGIRHYQNENYLSFGWGDENFYINTPTWGDLTLSNATRAMFLKSTTLVHVTRYKKQRTDWVEIKVNDAELQKLNSYLLKTFKTKTDGTKIMLKDKGYSPIDDFYKANGNYSCFNTCNSWVNTGFKESGLKSCLWTPFDFGLLNKYK
ncbi:DUF2459 domain-containing protein [Winogradskyella ouciana]|uniref:DUF2459 domain-containing protein n=1 Tax=Winogradskyella ouciana TaxID=2608631 RepID=A0A7K1GG57_9FLAO|nr:DUF2459 domain-containing protein [Winogradskyella ouciana]MTE28093.1 DUF2459 domain-containing protein [Winogradskyella ouciana]